MSRGRGRVQRELLAILREHERSARSVRELAMSLDATELASCVYWGSPHCKCLLDPKHEVAVRRTLAGLARDGLVIRLGTISGRVVGGASALLRSGDLPGLTPRR